MFIEERLAAIHEELKAIREGMRYAPLPGPHAVVENPPLAAPAAPFIAGAAPLPTAPVASTDSCPAPTTAFAQAVPLAPQPAATAAPPTASPAGSGERDAKGMPYDGRIHSGTKAKVADGTWRYKRGVGDTYIAQVEAELRAALAAPAPAAPAPAAPAPAAAPAAAAPVAGGVGTPWPFPDGATSPAPAAAVAVPVVQPTVAPPVVAAPPAATAVANTGANAAGPVSTYAQLMSQVPAKIVSGELTAAQLQQACEAVGVPSIAALATRDDLVPAVAKLLKLA